MFIEQIFKQFKGPLLCLQQLNYIQNDENRYMLYTEISKRKRVNFSTVKTSKTQTKAFVQKLRSFKVELSKLR